MNDSFLNGNSYVYLFENHKSKMPSMHIHIYNTQNQPKDQLDNLIITVMN